MVCYTKDQMTMLLSMLQSCYGHLIIALFFVVNNGNKNVGKKTMHTVNAGLICYFIGWQLFE